MKKTTLILVYFLLINFSPLIGQIKDSIYVQKRRETGVRMIKVAGENEVWTQKIGSGKNKLLLLHGGPGATHEYFENFPLHLDTLEYTIYLYEQLGSYFSDCPPLENLWQIDRFVEEVETVRKGLDITNFFLLGHSWGGILAIYYAIKYPENLEGLILSNTPVTYYGAFKYRNELYKAINKDLKSELGRKPETAELDKRYKQTHRYGLDTIPEVFIRLEKHYNNDKKKWDNGLFNKKDWNLKEQLKLIATRTLIIGGEKDFIDPNDFKMMHEIIPHNELIIIPNAPHFPMWSNSKVYFEAISNFVANARK